MSVELHPVLLVIGFYVILLILSKSLELLEFLYPYLRFSFYAIIIFIIFRALYYWHQMGSEDFFTDMTSGIWAFVGSILSIFPDIFSIFFNVVYEYPACGFLFIPLLLLLLWDKHTTQKAYMKAQSKEDSLFSEILDLTTESQKKDGVISTLESKLSMIGSLQIDSELVEEEDDLEKDNTKHIKIH
jgi:hypothetical protein